MKSKYIAILAVFVSGTLMGYVVGNHFSPDVTNPQTAALYLATYGVWQHIDSDHDRITLDAGNRRYTYTTGDTSVAVHQLPPGEVTKLQMPHRNMDKDLDRFLEAAAVGTGGAKVLANVMSTPAGATSVESFSKGEKAVVLIVTLGSFKLGYWLGHHSELDTSDPKFQETLSNEVSVWKDDNQDWRDEYEDAVAKRVVALRKRSLVALRLDPANSIFYQDTDTEPCGRSSAASHPEICNQVSDDPRVIAAMRPPPAPSLLSERNRRLLLGLDAGPTPNDALWLSQLIYEANTKSGEAKTKSVPPVQHLTIAPSSQVPAVKPQ